MHEIEVYMKERGKRACYTYMLGGSVNEAKETAKMLAHKYSDGKILRVKVSKRGQDE